VRAAIVEQPGKLVVRDIPRPQVGEYDVLCELLYGATCSGTDLHLIHGRFPNPVRYPTILGHESIGRVVEVGPKVRNFSVGDLVTRVGAPPTEELGVSWGGFAEYGIARDHWAAKEDGRPRQEWRSFRVNQRLPEGTDARAATMVITWRETLSYLTRMGFGAGASLLVIGSGGNGLAFARHAINLGASIVGMVGNAERERLGRAAGARHYFDYKCHNLLDQIGAACPEGFDFIIDAVGRSGALDAALPALKPEGTIGIYGIDDYGRCYLNPSRARGTFTYANRGYDEEETHQQVVAYMQQGALDARLWLDLDHPFPLDRIAEAFAAVQERKLVKALVRLTTERE